MMWDILMNIMLVALGLFGVFLLWGIMMAVINDVSKDYSWTAITPKLWSKGVGFKDYNYGTEYYKYFVFLFAQFETRDRDIRLMKIKGRSFLKPKRKKLTRIYKKGWVE